MKASETYFRQMLNPSNSKEVYTYGRICELEGRIDELKRTMDFGKPKQELRLRLCMNELQTLLTENGITI